MSPRIILAIIHCPLLVLAAIITWTAAEGRQTQPLYSEVVDKAFQFSKGVPAEFQAYDSRIVIRYLPAFGATEWQIVALKERSGTYHVIRYRIKPGTPSISEQYNQLLQQQPSASVDEILRGLSVEITDQKIEKSTVQLMNELDRLSIPTKFSPDLCIDGMTYELWVQTPSNEIHATLTDCAYGKDTSSTSIMRWIRAMQASFTRQK